MGYTEFVNPKQSEKPLHEVRHLCICKYNTQIADIVILENLLNKDRNIANWNAKYLFYRR